MVEARRCHLGDWYSRLISCTLHWSEPSSCTHVPAAVLAVIGEYGMDVGDDVRR
jgi:hypothetical protein